MRELGRRGVLAGLAAGGALLASPSIRAQAPRFAGQTLRVATFGGGWDRAVHRLAGAKLEELGAKVEYVTAPPRDNLARLIAARGRPAPFDVVEMGDLTWVDTFEAGFLQKIDLANVPNRREMLPSLSDEWKVASWATQEGIVWHTERFAAAGVPRPERYRDLLNPRLERKIALIDISQAGAAQLLVGSSMDDGGSMRDIEPGLRFVRAANPFQFWRVGAQAVTLMNSGDIMASTMHAGFAVQMRRAGLPVAFTHPRVGPTKRGLLKEGWLGVVRGTPVARAAEYFINEYVSYETQLGLARERGIVPINNRARDALVDDPLLKEMFLLSEADVANMVSVDFTVFNLDDATQRWSRALSAR